MAFSDKAEFQIPRHIVQKGGVNVETITADKTLTYSDSQYQFLTKNKCFLSTETTKHLLVLKYQEIHNIMKI